MKRHTIQVKAFGISSVTIQHYIAVEVLTGSFLWVLELPSLQDFEVAERSKRSMGVRRSQSGRPDSQPLSSQFVFWSHHPKFQGHAYLVARASALRMLQGRMPDVSNKVSYGDFFACIWDQGVDLHFSHALCPSSRGEAKPTMTSCGRRLDQIPTVLRPLVPLSR